MTRSDAPTVVLLPLRSFSDGKTRLAGAVPARRRAALARRWAAAVGAAARHLPVVVMTADAEVTAWAAAAERPVIRDPAPDLNGSLTAAVDALGRDGHTHVIVAHGDLPLADDLTWIEDLTRRDGVDHVVIVPDRRSDGTNVLAVPTASRFRFRYGPASSRAHQDEAYRLGLTTLTVTDPLLGWDVDLPEDLRVPEGAALARLREAATQVRHDAATRATVIR